MRLWQLQIYCMWCGWQFRQPKCEQMRKRSAAETAMQAVLAAIESARETGYDYFREQPDLMLVEVARHAATLSTDKNHQIAFLQGYSRARIQWQERDQ